MDEIRLKKKHITDDGDEVCATPLKHPSRSTKPWTPKDHGSVLKGWGQQAPRRLRSSKKKWEGGFLKICSFPTTPK